MIGGVAWALLIISVVSCGIVLHAALFSAGTMASRLAQWGLWVCLVLVSLSLAPAPFEFRTNPQHLLLIQQDTENGFAFLLVVLCWPTIGFATFVAVTALASRGRAEHVAGGSN